MIAALLVGYCAALDVADFFPTRAGTQWTYETISNGPKMVSVTTAGEPVDVGDQPAFPFKTTVGGSLAEIMHYRTSADTVYVVAYKATQVLDEPRPILKLGEKGTKWEVDTNEDGLPLSLKNESALRGRRKILDQDVDVIELKVDAVLGDKNSMAMEFKQTAIYARGIGLAELTEERKVSKKVYKRKVRLTKYVTPSAGGL